jgi:hypothetical protein
VAFGHLGAYGHYFLCGFFVDFVLYFFEFFWILIEWSDQKVEERKVGCVFPDLNIP